MSERKNELGNRQMTGAVFVEEARDYLSELVRAEAAGPGDWLPAMRRVARHAKIPYAKLWALRYRPPKDVGASVLFALRDAYERSHAHHLRMLEQAIADTKAAGDRPAYLDAAEAVVVAARQGTVTR